MKKARKHYTAEEKVAILRRHREPGTTARAQIAVYEPGAKAATGSEEITPVHGWQRLTHRVKLGSGDVLRVHLSRYEENGTIYWNDVEVSPSK